MCACARSESEETFPSLLFLAVLVPLLACASSKAQQQLDGRDGQCRRCRTNGVEERYFALGGIGGLSRSRVAWIDLFFFFPFHREKKGVVVSNSHLLSVDELQRTQRRLEVGGVGLQVMEGRGDLGLELRRVLARRAIGRDLVEGGGRHLDCVIPWEELTRIEMAVVEVDGGGGWMVKVGEHFFLRWQGPVAAEKDERQFQWVDESAASWSQPY